MTKNSDDYTYDAADQMTAAGGVSYGYDSNGNQTARGADTFSYDHENRLTQTVIGGVTSSSVYNGDGLRMSHTVSGQTTSYTWDLATGLPVVLQDGTNTYVYGLDLISATDGAGMQTYFLYDGLGSTTGLTDGSGNNPVSYSYDVFGAIRSQTGTSTNFWLFTGEQRDSDSSLYYLRARYYDPAIGRFIGRDPLPGTNLYAYVGNNPVRFVDPRGLVQSESSFVNPMRPRRPQSNGNGGGGWISGGIGLQGSVGAWAWGGCSGGGVVADTSGAYSYAEGCAGGGFFTPGGSIDLIGELNFGSDARGTAGVSSVHSACVHTPFFGLGGCGGFSIGKGYFSIFGGPGIGTPGVDVMGGGIMGRTVGKLKFWD